MLTSASSRKMQCLGEMSTWLPVPGAVPYYAARYVDDALGFAVGWQVCLTRPQRCSSAHAAQLWYSYAITIPVEVSAAAVIIGYWNDTINVSSIPIPAKRSDLLTQAKVAAWISILVPLIIFLNIFAIQIYGEAEFWFAIIKILTILGLLIMCLVIDLGGGPTHDRIGFRYWKDPGAMKPFLASGNTGRFWGFLYT